MKPLLSGWITGSAISHPCVGFGGCSAQIPSGSLHSLLEFYPEHPQKLTAIDSRRPLCGFLELSASFFPIQYFVPQIPAASASLNSDLGFTWQNFHATLVFFFFHATVWKSGSWQKARTTVSFDHSPDLVVVQYLETAVSYILSNFLIFFYSGKISLVLVTLSWLEEKEFPSFKDYILNSSDSKYFSYSHNLMDFGNWKGLCRIWGVAIWQWL